MRGFGAKNHLYIFHLKVFVFRISFVGFGAIWGFGARVWREGMARGCGARVWRGVWREGLAQGLARNLTSLYILVCSAHMMAQMWYARLFQNVAKCANMAISTGN